MVAQLTVNQLVAGSNPAARAKFMNPHDGGDPVSTGHVEVRSRVVDPRWPRKKRGQKVIANNDYALAA